MYALHQRVYVGQLSDEEEGDTKSDYSSYNVLIKGRNISEIQTLKILSNFKSESDDNCSFISFKI